MKKISWVVIIVYLLLDQVASAIPKVNFQVEGISGEVKTNVEATLASDIASSANGELDLKQFYQNAPKAIQDALQPFGYFKAKIHAYEQINQGQRIMIFRIDPGPVILVKQVDFQLTGSGASDEVFQEILKNFPISKNQVFSVKKYNLAKQELQNTAMQYGYFDAKFEQAQIKVDLPLYAVSITLHFETGPRYLFGPLLFQPQLYSYDFLKRFAPFSSGEKFDTEKLQTFQENLASSDYFKTVAVDSKPEEAEDLLTPIHVMLTPLPRREYDLGLGFGTNTGMRALFNYTARQITSSGQMFKSEIQASQVYSNAQANYIIPGKNPATDKYIIGGAVQQTNINAGNSLLEKLSASYTNSIFGVQQIVGLALQHENWSLTNQPRQSAVLLVPNIGWNKTWKDDDIEPTKGFRFNLLMLGAQAFGKNPFLQAKLNIKGIYPVFNIGSLVARADLGHTITKNPTTVPLSFDFFAGGTDSIRGYSFNSLGPGTNLLTTSLEYRQKIKKDWYLAGFMDTGTVSNSFPGKFKRGVGAGPVWQSPVGTLELTLARGLDTPGKPWLLQFSMGPDL